MFIKMWRYIVVLMCIFGLSNAYNILAIFPHQGKSHFWVFQPLIKELATKGHKLTVISHFPLTESIPNYRDVSLHGSLQPMVDVLTASDITGSRMEKYTGANFIANLAKPACEIGLPNEVLQNFLKEHNTFDVILAEFFNTNCFMGLVKKYKAPLVGLSSCVSMPWVHSWLGNPDNPSYIPVVFMDYSDQMTFLERVENTIMLVASKLIYRYFMEKPGIDLSKKYLGEDLDDDIMYNTSLYLVNTHYSLNRPMPLVPNVIEVGGMNIPKENKKLPLNLEKWINESSEGVIYFSLGSMIKGHTFPEDKRKAFLKAFGRLSQRVLWKWENETMEGKPDNVMIQKWMPQFDILCHPNVKAFISHGGLLGTTEAVHCGVPVLVMPQFGDQFTNARALEASGGGIILHLRDATEETVYQTLKKVLSADSRKKAKELSERFRDRPMPPLETAIYWVEYVARHRGAPHMRTAATDMPFYKYYLIDVLGFLITVVSLITYISYIVTRFIITKIYKQFKGGNKRLKTA